MPLRPRVLFASFDPVPAPKGASAHILQSATAIAALARVDLLTTPGSLPFPALDGVRHEAVPSDAGNFLQRALEFGDAVAERLERDRYDVVHVRSTWEGVPALLLRGSRGHRVLYEVNGLPSVELKYHYAGVLESPSLMSRIRAQERLLLLGADRILTPSRTTQRFLKRFGVSSSRVQVIPNGVDSARFVPTPLPPPGSGDPVVLYLGTLAPWQGLDFLLEAFHLAVQERPLRLQMVGPGAREWRRELAHRIRKLGLTERVEMPGALPPEEVPARIAGASLGVAPLAYTERNVVQGCCPIKLLEYLAGGRPAVAPRIPPVLEIVRHEESALLYKPDKPRRLAEAILRVVEDRPLGERLAAAGPALVRDRFTWQRHNEALQGVYRELLTGLPVLEPAA